jgi:hypothetical protein
MLNAKDFVGKEGNAQTSLVGYFYFLFARVVVSLRVFVVFFLLRPFWPLPPILVP